MWWGGRVGQRNRTSVKGAIIGEAKAITRFAIRTPTHAGREADYRGLHQRSEHLEEQG